MTADEILADRELLQKGDAFTCENCGGSFRSGWSDEDALAEVKANGWAEVPPPDMAIICDDCYQRLMA